MGTEDAHNLDPNSEISKFLETATLSDIEKIVEEELFFVKKKQTLLTEKRVVWLAHLQEKLLKLDDREASDREDLKQKRKRLAKELVALVPKYEEQRNELRGEIETLRNKLTKTDVTVP